MANVSETPVRYDAEMRFGVLMYGGVSLAIYKLYATGVTLRTAAGDIAVAPAGAGTMRTAQR